MIEEDENDILDSGLTRHQTEIALKKARMAYEISKKKNMPVNKNYYALLTIVSEYKGIICKNVTETIFRSFCPEKLDVKIICELCSQDVLYSSIIYIR